MRTRVIKVLAVTVALTVLSAGPAAATGTNPIYGTAGLFRTFSADTISHPDGRPNIGVDMFAMEAWLWDLGTGNNDVYAFPTVGLTVTPFKYVELSSHARFAFHYTEPVPATETIEGTLGDINMAFKGHATDQELTWVSLAGIVTLDLPVGQRDNPETYIADESTDFIAQGGKNITVLGLASKDFYNKMIGINVNAGYRIRTGRFNYGIQKGLDYTMDRPDELVYGIGFDVRPISVVSVIAEFTGSKTQNYVAGSEITNMDFTYDTNFDVTLGVRLNGLDMFHIGIGVTRKLNKSWGPYSGPDYKGFVQGTFDFPLVYGDRDGDGIRDNKDACPDDPEDFDGFEDWDGCPDPDNDQDGILDTVDQCPNDPEDKDGFKDEDGCPDPDNDNDGILDNVDKCPNDPEDFNGFEDEDGCPEGGKPVEVKRFILEDLRFKPNKAELVEGYYASLEKAGEQLKENPDITVTIEGHAASTGRPDFEMSLSRERAETIKNYLVRSYGVDASRITTVGYGSTKPIADNSTEAGRRQNRRIEYVVD